MMLILLGLLSGFIGGMGIGGGTLLIPGLVLLTSLPQQTIQSINLLSFVPVAAIALVVHGKQHRIDFRTALPLILFGLVGAWLGSRLALTLDSRWLRKGFGVFLFFMGLYELFGKGKD